jgi:DinB superfamily
VRDDGTAVPSDRPPELGLARARIVAAAGRREEWGMHDAADCERDRAELERLQREIEALHVQVGERASTVEPALSRWSIEQHLYHLALSADLALANVRALLDGTSARIVHQGGPNDVAQRVFAEGGYPRGQSQSPRAVWPPDRPERALLDAELGRVRAGVAELIGRGEAIASAAGRIAHRQLGELSAAEWLRFARLHTAHHLGIARDLARALEDQTDHPCRE